MLYMFRAVSPPSSGAQHYVALGQDPVAYLTLDQYPVTYSVLDKILVAYLNLE